MFGRRYYLTQDLEDWHTACWRWHFDNIDDARDLVRETPFILPTKDFFPPTKTAGHDRAAYMLKTIMDFGPTKGWPIHLEAQDVGPETQNLDPLIRTEGRSACGTFRIENDIPIISYDPLSLNQPQVLIGTLAHEVGHYLNGYFPTEAPGSDEFIEPATDVTAAFLGFGVFMVNSRFDQSNWSDGNLAGWQTQTRGYLTEAEWAFSIAMYAALGDHPLEPLKPHLKSHVWPQVKKAEKYIQKRSLDQAVLDTSASV